MATHSTVEPVSLMSPALAGGFFTSGTTWEAQFISKVEEVLNDWKLIGNSLGKPLEKVRSICWCL
ncbi:hypothetical protein FD755_008169 [Muntiacus reevesi]|uniref:Uncharacterized protein n=1 Tax=Muntiacus reevesi TaxID=9886 RepID=A0A5J5MIX7_MUNRE|nr:hypothetical protein FD755_008169 [Muntiacus reevesi]